MTVRALVKISGYFTHQHALVRPYGNDRAPRLKKPELLQRMIQAVIPRRLPGQPIIYEGKNVQLTDDVHDRPISDRTERFGDTRRARRSIDESPSGGTCSAHRQHEQVFDLQYRARTPVAWWRTPHPTSPGLRSTSELVRVRRANGRAKPISYRS